MNNIMSKIKWFIAAALVIIVAGLTVFAFAGFNNTADYGAGFEVRVRLEQEVDSAVEILKDTSDNYFESKKINVVDFQVEDDGAGIIYKLAEEVSEADVTALETAINEKLLASKNSATVTANFVYENPFMQTGKVLLALGISLVAIFLYMLIMNKLASAVAVICSSVLSILIYFSMIALVRLPAAPFVEITALIAGVIGAIMSVITVGNYREELNKANKQQTLEIANSIAQASFKKYVLALGVILVSAVALIAFFNQYMVIMGAQIAIAGLVAVTTAYFTTPLIWTAIKGQKK